MARLRLLVRALARASASGIPVTILASALALTLGACARYQHYEPAPLSVGGEATAYAAYAARRLDDPALQRVLTAHGVPIRVTAHDIVRDTAWNSRQLALAAIYFRPDITEAERALDVARAGEITAGARPYPSVTATAEHAARADEGHSTPWTLSLATGLTIERGGKRGGRIARARAVTLAAGLRLDAAVWQVVQGARASSVTVIAVDVDLADAEAELTQVRMVQKLLQERYTEGQISRLDLARSETDVQSSAVSVVQAEHARSDARAALARAIAVPLREVERIPLAPDKRSACSALASRSPDTHLDTLQVLALRTLPSVGASLADYAAAESDLRVQIAQQYPDIVIGPGITWEQGVRRWVLSLGLPGVAVDRARGPIAEARSRRAMQAARVGVLQDSVLAQVDSAAVQCRNADRDVVISDSLARASSEQLELTRASYDRGEIGKTEVALAELVLARARRLQHQATQRTMAAGVALENATGVWLSGQPLDLRDMILPPQPVMLGK